MEDDLGKIAKWLIILGLTILFAAMNFGGAYIVSCVWKLPFWQGAVLWILVYLGLEAAREAVEDTLK